MKFAVRLFTLGLLVSLYFAAPAAAQYLKITTDNPTNNTQLNASGTTVLTLTLDTNHDKDGSLQTCNSHANANCGAPTTANPLSLFSYQIYLHAEGGTVTWGNFTPADAAFTPLQPQVSNSNDVEFTYARPPGTSSPAGVNILGTISVTIVTGAPRVDIARFPNNPLDPTALGTSFGTNCDGAVIANTYILGNIADPCGVTSGLPPDWYDADGALAPAGANNAPTLAQPSNMTVNEGATADQSITATDLDGDPIAFSRVSSQTWVVVTTTTAGTGTGTGNIHLAPGFSDAGTHTVTVRASDGTASNDKTITVTVNDVNRAPTLAQPANMTVNEAATADQAITATDPDGQPLTFTKISGPTFVTVSTTAAGSGTGTGNIHVAPGFTDSGTYSVSVSASDGTSSDGKSLTVTVNNTDRPVVLNTITNMSVGAGATADQTITATDADEDAITFTFSGPAFMTVTPNAQVTTTRTANIHLAPPGGTSGTFSATVTASAGGATDTQSFTITVTGAANVAPVLAQPANMTVNEGATADQTLNATDADGNPITFTLVGGTPAFATVTTPTPGTGTAVGNLHLAPGFTSAGTYSVTVQASDGSANDQKTLTVTVLDTNRAPTLTQPSNMTVAEGATADQALTAIDPDDQPLTFSLQSGPTWATVTTTDPGTGTGHGNIHLAPPNGAEGTYSATIRVTDGAANNDKTITITVTGVNAAPVLAQPNNMTVDEGATADQTLNATDSDGNALTFSLVSGPTFASVTTTTPGTGTATGNLHLAPGFSDAGTYNATVQASDGLSNDQKSLIITVNNVNQAPDLATINNMTVAAGSTADQAISAMDADGDDIAITFSGPAFMTVTEDVQVGTTQTGNIHLAPPGGTTGTFSATVTATAGGQSVSQSFTITVTETNAAPTLAQPANMTVDEGATADQTLNATDPDGNPLSFTLVGGTPAFATVTTTSPGTGTATGNLHLAPGSDDAGTYSVTVRATDGGLSDDKTLIVTVNDVAAPNNPPVLAQPANMTVNEGATADQTLNATDVDGDAITFTLVGGTPAFATVTTTSPGTGTATGNLHLAPGSNDSGTYSVTVRASDGTANDDKTLLVQVNDVAAENRAPVADAGGPYSGTVGVPVNFNGTGSSDPDGDALTYSWDFDATDGIQQDATGATPTHTYGAPGTYTVTLTVTDNGTPNLSDSDTATATIAAVGGGALADVLLNASNRVIRLGVPNPWCIVLRPDNGSFDVHDVVASSVIASFAGVNIPALRVNVLEEDEEDGEEGDGERLRVCFSKEALATLFASLPEGTQTVDVVISGSLAAGGTFTATAEVAVQKGGGNGFAKGRDNNENGKGRGNHFGHASPNPFNPSTTISFELSQPGTVRLHVYNVSGRLVNTLANGFMGTGLHEVRWDGTTKDGKRVSSGVYFYVLQTPERTVKSQLIVAK